MAPLRYAAKLDPFLSLDCAPTPSTLAQSKERKGSNFAFWQHCRYVDGMAHELGMSPNQGPVLVRGTRRIKCCDLHCHSVCFSPRQKRSAAYVIDAVEQMPISGRISNLSM